MFIRILSRCGAALFVAGLVAGCSVSGSAASTPGAVRSASATASAGSADNCRWNRSSCLYEGKYEAGERGYAEEEAKRLNQAALQKFRRSGGR